MTVWETLPQGHSRREAKSFWVCRFYSKNYQRHRFSPAGLDQLNCSKLKYLLRCSRQLQVLFVFCLSSPLPFLTFSHSLKQWLQMTTFSQPIKSSLRCRDIVSLWLLFQFRFIFLYLYRIWSQSLRLWHYLIWRENFWLHKTTGLIFQHPLEIPHTLFLLVLDI